MPTFDIPTHEQARYDHNDTLAERAARVAELAVHGCPLAEVHGIGAGFAFDGEPPF